MVAPPTSISLVKSRLTYLFKQVILTSQNQLSICQLVNLIQFHNSILDLKIEQFS